MKMVITGGNSFLGEALHNYFRQSYKITVIGRSEPAFQANFVKWDGQSMGEWKEALDGVDVLINLAGKSVDCRYSEKNKNEILNSRIVTTNLLHEAIASNVSPPKIWMNAASATIYRDSRDRLNTEKEGEIGKGFSVDVCKAWENAFFTNHLIETRRIALRTTIVLGNKGGAFPVLVRLAKFGLGGRQGNGTQMFSWIHLQDFCRSLEHIISNEQLKGELNIAAPNPITNAFLMKQISRKTKLRMGLPAPKWILEIGAIILGTETELILKSRYVYPEKLKASKFTWLYPTVNQAIKNLI